VYARKADYGDQRLDRAVLFVPLIAVVAASLPADPTAGLIAIIASHAIEYGSSSCARCVIATATNQTTPACCPGWPAAQRAHGRCFGIKPAK